MYKVKRTLSGSSVRSVQSITSVSHSYQGMYITMRTSTTQPPHSVKPENSPKATGAYQTDVLNALRNANHGSEHKTGKRNSKRNSLSEDIDSSECLPWAYQDEKYFKKMKSKNKPNYSDCNSSQTSRNFGPETSGNLA